MLDTATYRKLFSRVGFCFFALMAATYVSQAVFGGLLTALFPQSVTAGWYIWVISYVPLYGIAVPIFFALLHALLPQNGPTPVRNDLNIVQTLVYLVLSFGTMYLFNLITGVLTMLISFLSNTPVMNPVLDIQQSSGFVWNFLFGCIVAPVGEEIIFRKVLYHKLGVLGDKCYILTGALIFGLFHGNLPQLFYAMALGALFCYIYARTGRLLYTIMLHILVNMAGMLLAPMALHNPQLLMLMGMGVLTSISVSIALAILLRRRARFTPPRVSLPVRPVRSALLSAGMVFYLLLSAATILATLLAPLWLGGAS